MTLLIASVFADTTDELDAQAKTAWELGADAVEARSDGFREGSQALSSFLRTHPDRQWLITRRTRREGGSFNGSAVEAARFVLEATQGTDAYLDVELEAWRADESLRRDVLSHLAGRPSAKLVLSAHFLDGKVPDLTAIVEEALAVGAQAVAKVAYAGAHIADSFPALDLMHRFGPRGVAICMGEAGAWTRVLARKLGAFASYATIPDALPTAPGQWNVRGLREDFRWERIDADTKVFGVAGDPVAQSLSPKLFAYWFGQHECKAVYVPLLVGRDRGGLRKFLDECESRPWLNVGGLSVTSPHKLDAVRWAGEAADPMSREIGAANTLVLGTGVPAAYNTDCYAAVDSLARALAKRREQLGGLTVDILGAGGAARAVVYGLSEMGCKITVFARSPEKGKDFERWGAEVREWSARTSGAGDVLIHCTPMGMWPHVGETPMPAEALKGRRLVFDLIYRPEKTKLLNEAAEAGCATLSGLDMFVRQAATQYALWMGHSPELSPARTMLNSLLGEAELQHSKSIVALIGARGSGKTTVGAHLARLLDLNHVDTDERIAAASGKSIAGIFAAEGEEGFRRREREAILAALDLGPAVISLGGGAVLDAESMGAVKKVAHVIWLTAPLPVLLERMARESSTKQNRPPLTSLDAHAEMARLIGEREPLYRSAADLTVETSQSSPDEIARRIADWMNWRSKS